MLFTAETNTSSCRSRPEGYAWGRGRFLCWEPGGRTGEETPQERYPHLQLPPTGSRCSHGDYGISLWAGLEFKHQRFCWRTRTGWTPREETKTFHGALNLTIPKTAESRQVLVLKTDYVLRIKFRSTVCMSYLEDTDSIYNHNQKNIHLTMLACSFHTVVQRVWIRVRVQVQVQGWLWGQKVTLLSSAGGGSCWLDVVDFLSDNLIDLNELNDRERSGLGLD